MIKKILFTLGGFLLFIALIFGIMMIKSQFFYDKSKIENRPNSFYISNNMEVNKSIEEVYNFVKYKMDDYYLEIDEMHKKFEIQNNDGLIEGAEVLCIEYENENQIIEHFYQVRKSIKNETIQFDSQKSIIYDITGPKRKKVFEFKTYVYFDFEKINTYNTKLTQTIVLDFKNPAAKVIFDIIGKISGNEEVWGTHFNEELTNFGKIIEKS